MEDPKGVDGVTGFANSYKKRKEKRERVVKHTFFDLSYVRVGGPPACLNPSPFFSERFDGFFLLNDKTIRKLLYKQMQYIFPLKFFFINDDHVLCKKLRSYTSTTLSRYRSCFGEIVYVPSRSLYISMCGFPLANSCTFPCISKTMSAYRKKSN